MPGFFLAILGRCRAIHDADGRSGLVTEVAERQLLRQALRSSPAWTWPVMQTFSVRAITLRALHAMCEEKATCRARPFAPLRGQA